MKPTSKDNETIKTIISELIPDLSKDEISDNTDIFDLGLDSINAMALVFNLQEAFSIKFEASDMDIENFHSVSDIVKLIAAKMSLEPQ
jgi:acyl carrier protein